MGKLEIPVDLCLHPAQFALFLARRDEVSQIFHGVLTLLS